MNKRIFSILLCVIMIFSMIHFTAAATEAETQTVYISVSDDSRYITDKNENPIAFTEVNLDKLAETIDLEAYNLGEYSYDADNDGDSEITALHLYIYIHEVVFGLDWSDVIVTGSSGSIYLAGGLFGFEDENLRYDLNGAYPVDEELSESWGYTVGATADRIVLSDGDFLNVAHYSNWAFYGDSATGFNYFTDEEGALKHIHKVTVGEELTLGLVRSFSDWSMGGSAAFENVSDYDIYYGTAYGEEKGKLTTNENGMLNISFPNDGTWYVWCDGGYGIENPEDIVSAPAFATINVSEFNEGTPDIFLDPDLQYGDANNDGRIDSIDLVELKKGIFNELTSEKFIDPNGDGKLDILDMILLKKYVLGTVNTLG